MDVPTRVFTRIKWFRAKYIVLRHFV